MREGVVLAVARGQRGVGKGFETSCIEKRLGVRSDCVADNSAIEADRSRHQAFTDRQTQALFVESTTSPSVAQLETLLPLIVHLHSSPIASLLSFNRLEALGNR